MTDDPTVQAPSRLEFGPSDNRFLNGPVNISLVPSVTVTEPLAEKETAQVRAYIEKLKETYIPPKLGEIFSNPEQK